jgi:hypothetical protein
MARKTASKDCFSQLLKRRRMRMAAQTTNTGAWLSPAQNPSQIFSIADIEAEQIERTESPILIGFGITKG